MTTNSSWWPPRWLALTMAAFAVAAIGYGLWWRHAAGLVETMLGEFRDQARAQGALASWESVSTSGFPLRLTTALANPRYADDRSGLAWNAGNLSVELLPWSLSQVNFAVSGAQELRLGRSLAISGAAKESGLSLLFRDDGMPKQLDVAAKGADATIRNAGASDIVVKGEVLAAHWRIDPQDVDPADGTDFDAALNATGATLTGIDLPFGPEIRDLKLHVTLRGVPALKGLQGAMDLPAWRKAGAPLAVRKLSFVSGGVDIQGSGILALDPDGTLNGRLDLLAGGLDKIVDVLSKRGAIPKDVRSTLFVTSTMLSATGAKAPIPLMFKDGKTYLGPAEIGPSPRIVF